MKNIVLCGFMGCGKSTVGRRLAPMTNRQFVDMDRYIEEQVGKRISTLFRDEGEEAFRKAETAACNALGGESGLIIATGGGAVLREENVAALKQNGLLVWLRVIPETVLSRLSRDQSRPLLMRDDKETAVRELMAARTPLYAAAADFTVDADGDAFSVARAIQKALKL